eukprot:281802_1
MINNKHSINTRQLDDKFGGKYNKYIAYIVDNLGKIVMERNEETFEIGRTFVVERGVVDTADIWGYGESNKNADAVCLETDQEILICGVGVLCCSTECTAKLTIYDDTD